jgi:peptidoglycan-associated lipoprotein
MLLALTLILCNVTKVDSQIYSLSMGNKAYENKQYAIAIEFYNKVLNNPDISKKERNETIFKIADSYRMMNNPRRAIDNYQRLIRAKYNDERPEILLHYALTLNTFGSYAQAIPLFEQYLKKFPESQEALTGKASSLFALENTKISKRWIVRNVRELNSPSDDFSAVFFDAKNASVVFTSNRKGTTGKDKDNWTNGAFSDLFVSTKTKNGSWGNIKLFDETGSINTPANEGVVSFANNFNTLYFTRADKMGNDKPYSQILQSDKTAQGWSKPVVVFSDHTGNVGHPTVFSNELGMIFSSNRDGSFGGKDLWKVTRNTKQEPFSNPVNLGAAINTVGDEMFPMLANDTTLYFSSNGLRGFGGLDLYSVRINGNQISDLEHLPLPVNSPEDDFGISFDVQDKKDFSHPKSRWQRWRRYLFFRTCNN